MSCRSLTGERNQMGMNDYRVRLQVIKTYVVEVNADSPEEAIESAMQSQTVEIETTGKLESAETDYAEIA